MTTLVNQQQLAAGLGVTDRRIRQLVEQRILPPADSEGCYDLATCRERYELYRSGNERDWSDFYRDAEAGIHETAAIFERAFADGATVADVKRASEAVSADMARAHFISAAKAKSQAEADLFKIIWDREEKHALGQLLYRGMELKGATAIVDDDTGEVIAVRRTYSDLPPQVEMPDAKGRVKSSKTNSERT